MRSKITRLIIGIVVVTGMAVSVSAFGSSVVMPVERAPVIGQDTVIGLVKYNIAKKPKRCRRIMSGA